MDRLSHSTRTWAEWSENKRQLFLKQFYNTIVLILVLCQSPEDPNMRKTVFNAFWICPWQHFFFFINTWYEYRAMYYVCGYLLRFELNFMKFNDIPQSKPQTCMDLENFSREVSEGKLYLLEGGLKFSIILLHVCEFNKSSFSRWGWDHPTPSWSAHNKHSKISIWQELITMEL